MEKIFYKFVILAIAIASSVAQTDPPTTPADVYVEGGCFCVPPNSCSVIDGNGPTDGSGQLDPRILTSGGAPSPITGANNETNIPVSTGIAPVLSTPETCEEGLELCCPAQGYSCGMAFPPVAGSPTPIDGQGQTPFGAYPWQAALLTNDNVFIASGVLIDHQHVLTAAHRLKDIEVSFKVRLGEWDAANQNEPLPAIEIQSGAIFVHPMYNPKNLHYDIAIIRMEANAPLGEYPTITNICLPSLPISNMRCWVSGWGKNDFVSGGQYQAVLKAVDVPLVDYDTCQDQLRTTRLGQNFLLDPETFICAGGEVAKDACTGDGGAPLSCSVGGRWYLTGIVSWGIGCGKAGVPGVYVNIFNMISWIQETTNSVLSNIKTTTKAPSNQTTKAGSSGASTFKSNSTATTKAGNTTSATTLSPKANNSTTPKANNATTISNKSSNATSVSPKPNNATTISPKANNATSVGSNGNATLTTKPSSVSNSTMNPSNSTSRKCTRTSTIEGSTEESTIPSEPDMTTVNSSGNVKAATKAPGTSTKAPGNSTNTKGNATKASESSTKAPIITTKVAGNSTTKASGNSTTKASGTATTKGAVNSTTAKAGTSQTTSGPSKRVQASLTSTKPIRASTTTEAPMTFKAINKRTTKVV